MWSQLTAVWDKNYTDETKNTKEGSVKWCSTVYNCQRSTEDKQVNVRDCGQEP